MSVRLAHLPPPEHEFIFRRIRYGNVSSGTVACLCGWNTTINIATTGEYKEEFLEAADRQKSWWLYLEHQWNIEEYTRARFNAIRAMFLGSDPAG